MNRRDALRHAIAPAVLGAAAILPKPPAGTDLSRGRAPIRLDANDASCPNGQVSQVTVNGVIYDNVTLADEIEGVVRYLCDARTGLKFSGNGPTPSALGTAEVRGWVVISFHPPAPPNVLDSVPDFVIRA